MIEIDGTALHQWDVGRRVVVTGIEVEYVHFANKGDTKAVIMGVVDTHAKIPDFLLQTGKQLCVYAVKDGITVGTRTFYVQKRERPENYVYEDDQRNYIYELIQNAQTAADNATAVAQELREAKDSGEFKGDPGEPATDDQVAAAVEAYMEEHPVEVPDVDMTGVVKSVNGISPDENGNVEIEAGGGGSGEPGKDGVSATREWNGTVLTVTSASGTSSADLKGEKGDPGKDAVYVGSGDMPDGYDIQIDPNGEADEFATREYVNAQIQAAINDTWEGSY